MPQGLKRRLPRRLALVAVATLALGGCIYSPAPYGYGGYYDGYYGYGYPGYYAAPAYYGPPVIGSVGFAFGGGEHRHFR